MKNFFREPPAQIQELLPKIGYKLTKLITKIIIVSRIIKMQIQPEN